MRFNVLLLLVLLPLAARAGIIFDFQYGAGAEL
jgi:hypothetical protein